jgi:hypothetical protein
MNNKFIFAGLFFVAMLLSGFWLHRSGRPFGMLLLTLHKLISLGALVYLAITIYRIHQVVPLSPLELAACAATALFFIILFATGGILAAAKSERLVIFRVHQVAPYLAILSTAATLFLLLVRRA